MSALSYKVVNAKGKEVGTMNLDAEVFGGEINETLVHSVVTWQLSKRRAGTHSTLSKGMMEGCGKKPWKQKGTGRARAGSADSPLWVGGGVTFGPKPRSYEKRMSKRVRRQALVSVLTEKAKESSLLVLDDMHVKSGKTKDFAAMMESLGIQGKGTVVVVAPRDPMVERSSRNIPKVIALPVEGVNVYDLLKHKYLVCTKDGIEALQKRIKGSEK